MENLDGPTASRLPGKYLLGIAIAGAALHFAAHRSARHLKFFQAMPQKPWHSASMIKPSFG